MGFDIEELKRDWIEGVSGCEFYERVQQHRADSGQGCAIICKAEPVQFAVEFFAALLEGRAIALANPRWGVQERLQFDSLLEMEPEEGAILIPTGGTTGGVKLAIHRWASLVAASEALQQFLGGGPIHSCCVLPLHHVSGLMQLVRSFISEGSIRFDQDQVEGACLSLVPTQLQRMVDDPECTQKLNTARCIFIGGAPMPETLAQKARELKLPVVPVYGMTETAAMCAAIPNEDFLKSASIGAVALPGAAFSGEADGRLRIQSPALFLGYHGAPPVDLSSGYLTGDLGYIDDSGRLHVTGRADRIIITGGEKVDPEEVEAAMLQVDLIESVRVYGESDGEWGQALVAKAVISGPIEHEAIKGELSKMLSPHKIPKRIDFVDELPGKEILEA